MHPNLANVTRTWVATTILTGIPLIPSEMHQLNSTPYHQPINSTSSTPFYLIHWKPTNRQTNQQKDDQLNTTITTQFNNNKENIPLTQAKKRLPSNPYINPRKNHGNKVTHQNKITNNNTLTLALKQIKDHLSF
jgi:hypothetical protein